MLYAHGLEFRFDLQPTDAVGTVAGFEEHRGRNYGKEVDISLKASQCDTSVQNAQSNLIRFYRDPQTKNFTHPVAYIERGGHEMWPTTAWSYYGAQKHDGQGANILTATPPNLGEVEHPLSDYPWALPILRFNGCWGAYGSLNDSPPGPPLHGQWAWPGDSSIEWLLPKGRGY